MEISLLGGTPFGTIVKKEYKLLHDYIHAYFDVLNPKSESVFHSLIFRNNPKFREILSWKQLELQPFYVRRGMKVLEDIFLLLFFCNELFYFTLFFAVVSEVLKSVKMRVRKYNFKIIRQPNFFQQFPNQILVIHTLLIRQENLSNFLESQRCYSFSITFL